MGHDSSGMALFAKGSKGFSAVGVDVAETMALSIVVKEATSLGFSQVEFLSDSLHVVHLFNCSNAAINKRSLIVDEIRCQCMNRNFIFRYVPRLRNKVAHVFFALHFFGRCGNLELCVPRVTWYFDI